MNICCIIFISLMEMIRAALQQFACDLMMAHSNVAMQVSRQAAFGSNASIEVGGLWWQREYIGVGGFSWKVLLESFSSLQENRNVRFFILCNFIMEHQSSLLRCFQFHCIFLFVLQNKNNKFGNNSVIIIQIE